MRPIPLSDYDRWKLDNREDEEARQDAAEQDYEDRADELYQRWKEGDL